MDKKFNTAAKKLFYPDVSGDRKKRKAVKVKKDHYILYKLLFLGSLLILTFYAVFLGFFGNQIFDSSQSISGKLTYEMLFYAIFFIILISFVLIFSSFKNSEYSKSRAMRAVVTVLSCLSLGSVILSFVMSLEMSNITPAAIFVFLLISFVVAYIAFFYIILAYEKNSEKYADKAIRRVPKWLLFWVILLGVPFVSTSVSESYIEANRITFKAYNAVYYILTEDEYNLSFGTKNVTELVSMELVNKPTITNYEAKCIPCGFLSLKSVKDKPLNSKDVFDMKELSKIDGLDTVWVENVPLVKNVASLYQVDELKFTNCTVEAPKESMLGLKELEFWESDIAYGDFIKQTPYLTGLDIHFGKANKINIRELTSLKYLTRLGLYNADVSNGKYMALFEGLTSLSVWSANKLAKPNFLLSDSCIDSIVYLSLKNAELEYYRNSILRMKELKDLCIDNGDFSDITCLSELDKLNSINLSNNGIKDITALSGKKNLTRIAMPGNKIKDISALSELENLVLLNLDDNEIEDITPISNLYNLEAVSMNNNKIDLIPYLSCGESLKTLYLRNNKIEDVSALSGFTNLENLDMDENPISDEQLKMLSGSVRAS